MDIHTIRYSTFIYMLAPNGCLYKETFGSLGSNIWQHKMLPNIRELETGHSVPPPHQRSMAAAPCRFVSSRSKIRCCRLIFQTTYLLSRLLKICTSPSLIPIPHPHPSLFRRQKLEIKLKTAANVSWACLWTCGTCWVCWVLLLFNLLQCWRLWSEPPPACLLFIQ